MALFWSVGYILNMIYNQSDFSGGLKFFTSHLNIPQNGYYYLANARQRLGHIEAINKTIKITAVPDGKKQGHIGLGDILIEFIAGKAYYNADGSPLWLQVPNFSMSPTVDRYFAQAVPASTFNFARKLAASGNINDPIQAGRYFAVNGNIAGIVVQDGVSQPRIIYQDIETGNIIARPTLAYDGWTPTNPEYVPIGLQMMFLDTKLYVVAPDSKSVYQSVSGMPLNFIVNVDIDGNKLATEALGGAATVSFNFDNDPITCIFPINIPDSFIYGTDKNVRVVTLDFTNTVFGEPTYTSTPSAYPTGIVNQDSILDNLGDYAFIDTRGVKSFNAVQQLKWRGENSIFSLSLSRLLQIDNNKTIKQTRCRCISFDDYSIFAIDTKWGFLLAVFDTLVQTWVALDIIEGLSSVKQFTIIDTDTTSKLYAITENDELYQLYGDVTNREMASLHTRVFSKVRPNVASDVYVANPQLSVTQKSESLRLLFQDGANDTNVTVQEMNDGKLSQRKTITLPDNISGVGPGPIFPPVIPSIKRRSEPLMFNLGTLSKECSKVSLVIQWTSSAKLQALELITSDGTPPIGTQQISQNLSKTQYSSTK